MQGSLPSLDISAAIANAPIGPLETATHVGTCGTPGEGAYVRIWLIAQNNQILAASYATHGCPSSAKAAATTVFLIRNRTVDQAFRLEGPEIALLAELPEGRGHFADMAVRALKSALEKNP